MSRGIPVTRSPGLAGGAVERTREAWNDAPPDWVLALAEACEFESQARVAKRIGYAPPTISQVLSNRYGAGLGEIEQAVRDSLAGKTVLCPGLQGEEIEAMRCRAYQYQKKARVAGNPMLTRVWRACRAGCPHSRLTPPQGDDRC